MEYNIRKLLIDDLLNYKSIRLELLQNEPMNFGSSFEEENMFSDKIWIDRLTKSNITAFGAFVDDKIVGVVLLVLNLRKKLFHVATINSMYVREEYRKLGIGNALIGKTILHARQAGVEIINLSVVSTNHSAHSLYKKHGFIQYGEEHKAIKYFNKYSNLILMSKEL